MKINRTEGIRAAHRYLDDLAVEAALCSHRWWDLGALIGFSVTCFLATLALGGAAWWLVETVG